MSHLLCAFTLGTQPKHQYDIYFGKSIGKFMDTVCFIFSLLLITAEEVILEKVHKFESTSFADHSD